MEDDSGVLFTRGDEINDESADEDVWDDTALIEAYDRAVSLAKEEVQRRMGNASNASNNVTSAAHGVRKTFGKKENKKRNQQQKNQNLTALSANGDQWKVGMSCQCVYHEDGIQYEAVIENLSMEEGICKIKFIGYENTQLSTIDELLPTEGRWAQKKQIQEAKIAQNVAAPQGEVMDWSDINAPPGKDAASHKPPMAKFPMPGQIPFSEIPPPPPLTQFTDRLPAEESEALSSMLMSWYLNGFHTGYYLGLKQGKDQNSAKN